MFNVVRIKPGRSEYKNGRAVKGELEYFDWIVVVRENSHDHP